MKPVSYAVGPSYPFTKQGIYEESSTAKHKMGDRLQLGDRTFHYALAGEAHSAGFLQEQAAFGGAGTTLQNTQAVAVAAPIGSTKIYTTALSTAQSAAVFDDGYMGIWDATTAGMCYLYRIKTNIALATTGTTSYVELYDGVHIALTTSDQVSLIANPYKSLVVAAATAVGRAMGVPPISVTSAYYYWLQTWGPCAVHPEAALDLDEGVVRSDATAGTVCKQSAATAGQYIGSCLHIGTASECSIVFLELAP